MSMTDILYTKTEEIEKLYVAYFTRAADVPGLDFWQRVPLLPPESIDLIASEFAKSKEYQDTYGGKTPHEVVNAVYMNLFGRAAEPAGLDFWAGHLAAGRLTIDRIVLDVAHGAQNEDAIALNNKVKAATVFTNEINFAPGHTAYAGPEVSAIAKAFIASVTDDASFAKAVAGMNTTVAQFIAASKVPFNFMLTEGRDSGKFFTGGGGNDTFRASGAGFSTGDELDGGGGANRLELLNDGSLTSRPDGVKLIRIQDVSMNAKGAIGTAAAAYDFSMAEGLERVVAKATGLVHLSLKSNVAATIETPGSVKVLGGMDITLVGPGGAVDLRSDSLTRVALSNSSQNILIDNRTEGHLLNLQIAGVRSGARMTDASAAEVTVRALGSDSDFVPQFGKATSMSVELGANVKLNATDLAAADKLTTLTMSGAMALESDLSGISSLANVNAANASGLIKVNVSAASGLAYSGSSGKDLVDLTGKLATPSVVNLNGGDDRYTFTVAAEAGSKVRGGNGRDTMVVNDGALLNVAGIYEEFEILDFKGGVGKYNLGHAGSVTQLEANATLRGEVNFFNARAGTSLALSSTPEQAVFLEGEISIVYQDASGADDRLNISLLAIDGRDDGVAKGKVSSGSIDVTGIETVTVSSNVLAVDRNDSTTAVDEATHSNQYTNEITFLRLEGTKIVNISGSASFDLTGIYCDALKVIDASTATGNVWMGTPVTAAGEDKLRVSYYGSAGIDNIFGTDPGMKFQGNGGGDELRLTLGNGRDEILYVRQSDSRLGADKSQVEMDTINFFESGIDQIKLAIADIGQTVVQYDLQVLNDVHLWDFIAEKSARMFGSASVACASDGSNSAVFIDADRNGSFSPEHDMVVQLVGTPRVVIGDFGLLADGLLG